LGAELPKGWEGSFELERGNSVVEDFIAATESRYFHGGSTGSITMYQYIDETDGSTSTYQYSSVTFKLVNAGIWKGESSVKQKLEYFSVSRTRI
jgi:hypothetical protein